MFTNILVAVDGSDHSLKAALVAGELARSLGAELRVVVAYDPVPADLGEPYLQEAMTARLAYADETHQAAQNEIGETPSELKQETLEGPPAEAILSVAGARGVDLIVMGSRGLSRLANILIGSQSQKVVAQANCPVLLVR